MKLFSFSNSVIMNGSLMTLSVLTLEKLIYNIMNQKISGLAVLKQEAKDFRWRQMSRERNKRGQWAPFYQVARHYCPGSAFRNKICCILPDWLT